MNASFPSNTAYNLTFHPQYAGMASQGVERAGQGGGEKCLQRAAHLSQLPDNHTDS
jgi:hypothetical protein